MTYGTRIFNSDGVPIIDTSFRSMEAVQWGTMNLTDRAGYRLDLLTGIVAPVVFIRPHTFSFIVRGFPKSDGTGPHVNFSADRDCSVDYVVGGFRFTNPIVNTGFGLNCWREDGLLTFSSNLAYVRMPYRSITLGVIGNNPNVWRSHTMISGGSPTYQHPPWAANDYLHWQPFAYYSKDSGANWHYGMWFGDATPWGYADTRYMETRRVDLSVSLAGWDLGFLGSVPINMTPGALLSCSFVPPP